MLNLVSPHTLTVGTYANYFPQEYVEASSHQVIGFDIDVIRAMAAHMHLQPNFVTEDYSMLISDLSINRFDIVISAVSITPELQKKVDFIPYFKGGESLLVMKGNPYAIYALPDLCGRKVAVKEGTFEQRELKDVSATCVKAGRPVIFVVLCAQYSAALQQLTDKNVAAIYQDSPVSDYFIKQNPNLFETGGVMIGPNMEGIVVRKSDTPLFNALQQALMLIKADGSYHELITRWGLTSGDITVNEAKASHGRQSLAMTL
ncbi:MAG: ABC transporter substrate-binding protein [Ktedonobacteraceae bacterium]